MIDVDIPGFGHVALRHLVLDMNGTVATGGAIHESLRVLLGELRSCLDVHVISADTFGTLEREASSFGLQWCALPRGVLEDEAKRAFTRDLGAVHVVAMGNGNNDTLMLEEARIGICVVGPEGATRGALLAADVVVSDPSDGFRVLLEPTRLVATLRR